MTSSAWPLARRGRCGPCIALMTKKVEEGRRRVCIFMHWRASSAPRRALSFLLALTWLVCYPPSGRQQTQPLRIQTVPHDRVALR